MQSDFIDGGNINWANQSDGKDTQTQIGNLMASGGMVPMLRPTMSQQLNMAHGGHVDHLERMGPEGLISMIREEFRKRGLDFDRYMAHRMSHSRK